MRSVKSKFKLIKRGFTNPLVLIPGWATDYRIFDSLDLNYDYILPVEFSPLDFEAALSSYLEKNSIHKISLFQSSCLFVALIFSEIILKRIFLSIEQKKLLMSSFKKYPSQLISSR